MNTLKSEPATPHTIDPNHFEIRIAFCDLATICSRYADSVPHNASYFFHNVDFSANFITVCEGNCLRMSLLFIRNRSKSKDVLFGSTAGAGLRWNATGAGDLRDEEPAAAIKKDRPAAVFEFELAITTHRRAQPLPQKDAGRTGTARVECMIRMIARSLRPWMGGTCRLLTSRDRSSPSQKISSGKPLPASQHLGCCRPNAPTRSNQRR